MASQALVALLVLLGLAQASAALRPTPGTLSLTTNYYEVTGTTIGEVNASKLRNRPWKTSLAYDATTAWDVRWNYRYSEEGDSFRVASFQTQTRITLTLPRWKPTTEADPELVERWPLYWKALLAHEQGHVELARQAAAEVQRQVTALASFPSAQALTAALEDIANRVIKQFRLREAAFDQQTGHGMKQGATLP